MRTKQPQPFAKDVLLATHPILAVCAKSGKLIPKANGAIFHRHLVHANDLCITLIHTNPQKNTINLYLEDVPTNAEIERIISWHNFA